MTPLEINMLLHIANCRGPLPSAEFQAQQDTIQHFLIEELVTHDKGEEAADHRMRLTQRGAAMVYALTHLPLPVQAWRMPGSDTVIL